MSKLHVIAVPTHTDSMDEGVMLSAEVSTKEEAVAAVIAAGYTVIPEGNGGSIDRYDAEDAPGIYGYEHDGMGAYGITVVPA